MTWRVLPVRRARGVSLLLAAALVVASAASAAGQEWHVEAQAGQIRAVSDISWATADTLLVGARFDHRLGGLRLSTGLPTGSDTPLWGAAGGWRRLARRSQSGFVAGVDLAGNAFLLQDRAARALPLAGSTSPAEASSAAGYAAAGQLQPVVGFESRAFQIYGRSGVSQYRSRLRHDVRDRRVWLSDVQALVTPVPSLALLPALRDIRGPEGGYTYAGMTAMTTHRAISVWASAGRWLTEEDAGLPWAAGGSLRVHPRLTFNVSMRQDTLDPIHLRVPLRSWHVGASLRLSALRPRPPVPAAYAGGQATIRLPVSRARRPPRIAGDFTGWEPHEMQRTGDHWTYEVPLAPGVYHYAFVTQDDEWFVPEQTPGRRDDGMGGHVAVLVVAP